MRSLEMGPVWEYAQDALAFFIMFDHVKIVEDVIILTEKGRAFVEVLKDKGYVVDKVDMVSRHGNNK